MSASNDRLAETVTSSAMLLAWIAKETKRMRLGTGTILKPLQQPHPPIIATAVAPFPKGVTEAAARGVGADCRELPATAMCRHPLAEICRGL